MTSFSRKTKIFLVLTAALGVYVVVALARSFSGGVPLEFSEARLQGAMISQNIVDTSNESVEGLEEINRLDKGGDFTQALNLITETVTKSQDIRGDAIKLAAQLEKMTRALSDLKSFEARQAALESISNHLALIARLINYSDYLSRLLEVLRSKFTGDFSSGEKVDALVLQINTEVNAINNFNKQASEAMKRFDDLVR